MCVCVCVCTKVVLQCCSCLCCGTRVSLARCSSFRHSFCACHLSVRRCIPHQQKLAQPCQNASVAGAILMVECGYVEQIANYDSSGNLVQYCQLSTDVAHKQSRHLAREGATPARFKRKGNRAVSLPPPPSGSSVQPISLYFGGHLSLQSPAQKD